ncbi:hypothetical protein CAPTEDRAFT_192577 [Capitella teleta]|uniref:Uncharacterized protein n=1 Tax=Capitella teleta TaxID=283909 RepID=R7V2J6_CAPTE|nr:hypothetical protein CAPTEDRAFT_192577 [Capitella teleta]|eukprot:ELU12754.1 hypothetical protein CAPTEDRAFT_192577 [Capitella teleta]
MDSSSKKALIRRVRERIWKEWSLTSILQLSQPEKEAVEQVLTAVEPSSPTHSPKLSFAQMKQIVSVSLPLLFLLMSGDNTPADLRSRSGSIVDGSEEKDRSSDPYPCNVNASSSVCNSVLGYLVGSLKKSPRDVVKKIALSHFCPDEIKTAKQALWSSSACVPAIGPWKPRKGSSNKPRQEFEIDDIFDVLSKLDEASVKPVIHVPALDLDLLPPMNHAQLLPVIFLDKMNEMEAKMAAMQA